MAWHSHRFGPSRTIFAAWLLSTLPAGSVAALEAIQSVGIAPLAQLPIGKADLLDRQITAPAPEARLGKCRVPVSAQSSAAVSGGMQPFINKSATILGGMSALEMMRSDQLTFARSPEEEPAAVGITAATLAATLEPAIGGTALRDSSCFEAEPATQLSRPGLNRLPQPASGRGDYLLSRRVAIGKTRFDAQWRRVSGGGVSARQLQLVAGRRETIDTGLLGRVNAWVNHNISYADDSRLWGSADYWATAGETLRRASGDCEDLAIVKMKLLERAGLPKDAMYLTVARDLYRNADHAFLVVKVDGNYYVLDNAVDQVLLADKDLGYRPVLSFGNRGSWLHGY